MRMFHGDEHGFRVLLFQSQDRQLYLMIAQVLQVDLLASKFRLRGIRINWRGINHHQGAGLGCLGNGQAGRTRKCGVVL